MKSKILAEMTVAVAPWKASRFCHINGTLDTTPCAWLDKKMAEAGLRPDLKMTNEVAAKTKIFTELCDMAGVKPTVRQASKFRNGLGILWEKYKKVAP